MVLETFIKRPIFSTVISILIVLVGVLSLLTLPIERYPSIAPPTVEVTTTFFGASSETVLKSVVAPLEESIHGVENMIYMYSISSNTGAVQIDVVFKSGTDPDINTVNVQNRVSKATAQLPKEVKDYGVTVEKLENSMLQIFSLYSPDGSYDYDFLCNYADINIKPRILSINGIGKFLMVGSNYSMRIWLDPAVMAAHKLVPSDILSVLSSQNIEAATGAIGQYSNETFQYTMKYTGRLKTVKEFEDIVIVSEKDGSILRLGDVAKINLGIETYATDGIANGQPGVMCIAYQSTGSNATQINKEIAKVLDQIRKESPKGVDVAVLMDTNDFLYAAIDQVLETLRDAIFLVILIVLIFLKDFRSTLIPFISIMVSLIGTFAFMTVAGFSVNLLTLFALVLVIGTVVDDSIVVVEAVHAKFEEGVTSPFKAAVGAMEEVMMPVITSSLVFMAVFIPVSFMGGMSGVFYKQFGLTMAVAVGISALNALTLVPALCAMILKPIKPIAEGEKGTFQQRYARWFDGMFHRFEESYKRGLTKVLKVKPIVWFVSVGALAVLVILMKIMPGGLVPVEDQGLIMVEIGTPPGTSLYTTHDIARRFMNEMMEVPGIADVGEASGFGFIAGSKVSSASIVAKLDPWEERGGETSFIGIYKKLLALSRKYPEANFTIFSIPMIPGYGTSSGVDMYLQDRKGGSIRELFDIAVDFKRELEARGLSAYMAFDMDFPQWQVSVDVAKCMRAGLSPQEVLSTLGTYYGGTYTTDINLFSKVYKVMVMGNPDDTRNEQTLNKIYCRTKDGIMTPLTAFVSLKRVYGPDIIKNFNKYTSVNMSVTSMLSSGQNISIIKEVAAQTLPEGYTVDFAGMAREEENQGSLGAILILCSFIIYLLLCALYESWLIPISVLLAVPLGLAGSYLASYLIGLDNNIYLQTGVIMLIGLLSKTAILITEYAVDRHKKGMPIEQAAVEAAGARVRAILMTAGTMVIGLFPLILSISGVGGQGNFSLGLGTIVGMIMGTVGLLFITPVMFTTFQKIQDKINEGNKDRYE